MTLIIYFFIVFFSVLQSAMAKVYNKKSDDALFFNMIKALTAFLLFAVFGIKGVYCRETVIYGCMYGGCLCISMYSGYKALCCGPMAITSMIVSFSVVMPIAYGVAFCGDVLNVLKISGMIFLICAIISSNFDKITDKLSAKSKENDNQYGRWISYTAITFISNGFCSIVQKTYQLNYSGLYCTEFMIAGMLVCSVVFVFLNMMSFKSITENKGKTFRKKATDKYAVIAGVANAVVGYGVLKLAEFESASVLFSVISAGTTLCTLLCGRLFFKEALKLNHIIAMAMGITAVIFLKL